MTALMPDDDVPSTRSCSAAAAMVAVLLVAAWCANALISQLALRYWQPGFVGTWEQVAGDCIWVRRTSSTDDGIGDALAHVRLRLAPSLSWEGRGQLTFCLSRSVETQTAGGVRYLAAIPEVSVPVDWLKGGALLSNQPRTIYLDMDLANVRPASYAVLVVHRLQLRWDLSDAGRVLTLSTPAMSTTLRRVDETAVQKR